MAISILLLSAKFSVETITVTTIAAAGQGIRNRSVLVFAILPLAILPQTGGILSFVLCVAVYLVPRLVESAIEIADDHARENGYISGSRMDAHRMTIHVLWGWIQRPVRFLTVAGLVFLSLQDLGIVPTLWLAASGIPFIFGRYWLSLIFSAAIAIVGHSFAALVLAALSAAALTWVLSARVPRARLATPVKSWFRRPSQALVLFKIDRALAAGDLDLARARLIGAKRDEPEYRLREAMIDCEERAFQSSLDLAEIVDKIRSHDQLFYRLQLVRGLTGTGQFVAAEEELRRLNSTNRDSDERFAAEIEITALENQFRRGDRSPVLEACTALLGRLPTRDWWQRVRVASLGFEAASISGEEKEILLWSDRLFWESARNRSLLYTFEHTRGGLVLVRKMFGRKGRKYVALVTRMQASALNSAPGHGPAQPVDEDAETDRMAILAALSATGSNALLVAELRAQAAYLLRVRKPKEALGALCRALMELDSTRYSLVAQSSRSAWSGMFHEVVGDAMKLAHQTADSRLLAELIEFARTQTLTQATSAGFALDTPPAVRVAGISRLSMPGVPMRKRHIDLEQAADAYGGTGAVWLSYWLHEEYLYWAIIRREEGVESGRISASVDSQLRRLLDQLEEALPVTKAGESPAQLDFRVAASVLLGEPGAEISFSAELASALIPEPLLNLCRGRLTSSKERLPLVIAPVPALGYVPWSALVVDGSSERAVRLVDWFDWSLAPTASLAANSVGLDGPGESAPLRVVVADTTQTSEFVELIAARAQATDLAARGVTVLGGAHWTQRVASSESLLESMQSQAEPYSLAFLCHAVRGSDAEPSAGGLLLSAVNGPTGTPAILRPADVLSLRKLVCMPRNVILQACDTAALSDTRAGEWLTIAPAFIAAGASTVISTLFPVLEPLEGVKAQGHDSILDIALRGDRIATGVRDYQRQMAHVWSSGSAADRPEESAPIYWGAYAVISLTKSIPPRHSRVTHSSGRMQAILRSISTSNADVVNSGSFLASYLEYTDLPLLFGGGEPEFTISRHVWLWHLAPVLLAGWRVGKDPTASRDVPGLVRKIQVSDTLRAAFAEGIRVADMDGRDLEPEDVLIALLDAPSGALRILQWMNWLTGVRPEVVNRAARHLRGMAVAKSGGVAPAGDIFSTADLSLEAQAVAQYLGLTEGDLGDLANS